MDFLRYLRQKVKETNSEIISLIPSKEMLHFLDKFNIHYKQTSSELYLVSSRDLKSLFCN